VQGPKTRANLREGVRERAVGHEHTRVTMRADA
jgi:hypothetical protein